jgi:Flp pilus assembly protein TadD
MNNRRCRSRGPLLALGLALAAAAAAGPGGTPLAAGELPNDREDWIEVRSANFLLWSDAGERKARAVAADLEQVRSALAQLAPSLGLTAPCPTFIYVFKNRFAFARYPLEFQGRRIEGTVGFFLGAPWANYMAIDADRGVDALHVVRHEYLHYLLHNNYRRLPLWLDEGLAEYYGTLTRAGERVRIGMPIVEHIGWLRSNVMMPLDQLFAVGRESKDYHEGIRQGVFYAESWALTHYLLLGNPARRPQVAQMSKLMEAGVSQEKAFAQAFGDDYQGLERELRVYVGKNLWLHQELPLAAAAETAAAVRPLPPADVLYRLGDLLLNMDPDHGARAAEHFQAALAVNPRLGLALAGLGELDEREGRASAARERYAKAIEVAPGEGFVHYLLGRALLARGEPDATLTAAAELERATVLAPGFGEAWATLAVARMNLDPGSPAALTALETAHRLLPQRTDVTLNLAVGYAWNGARGKAEALIARARSNASAAELESARQGLAQADHHRFVTSFNQAVQLANSGNEAAAVERLAALIAATPDAADQAEARRLLDQIAARKKQPPR